MNNLLDELKELQKLHESGVLTAEEFAQAKSKLLSADAVQTAPSTGADAPATNRQVEELRLQNELLQLDREWDRNQEEYMFRDRYGRRRVPAEGEGVIAGVLLGVTGVFGIILMAAVKMLNAGFILGALMITIGIIVALRSTNQAREYQEAKGHYELRRSKLLDAIRQVQP
jgi:hypothetical protein